MIPLILASLVYVNDTTMNKLAVNETSHDVTGGSK